MTIAASVQDYLARECEPYETIARAHRGQRTVRRLRTITALIHVTTSSLCENSETERSRRRRLTCGGAVGTPFQRLRITGRGFGRELQEQSKSLPRDVPASTYELTSAI